MFHSYNLYIFFAYNHHKLFETLFYKLWETIEKNLQELEHQYCITQLLFLNVRTVYAFWCFPWFHLSLNSHWNWKKNLVLPYGLQNFDNTNFLSLRTKQLIDIHYLLALLVYVSGSWIISLVTQALQYISLLRLKICANLKSKHSTKQYLLQDIFLYIINIVTKFNVILLLLFILIFYFTRYRSVRR